MKILLIGATGFTGSYVLRKLVEQGFPDIRCLVRESSRLDLLPVDEIEVARGSLDHPLSLAQAMEGIDTLINVASIGFGHAPVLVSTAEKAGVTRALFISTTAIFTSLNAASKAVRLAAEESIQRSSLRWTILRPTMIYGSRRDRNICRLIRFVRRCPVIPVAGPGKHLLQPVYVEDVAKAVADAFHSTITICKSYTISGANPLTYNEVIDTISRLLKRSVIKCHLPVNPVVTLMRSFEWARLRLPVSSEQILRLNENKAFDHRDAARDWGYSPRTFLEGVKRELVEMGYARQECEP